MAARRSSLADTNDNSADFAGVDYRVWSASNPDRTTDEQLEVYRPKNLAHGTWDPFQEPPEPVEPDPTEKLIILQANTYGNDNGGGGGFPRSLVELYNNTKTAIDLTAGNYYLHIGNAADWTTVIKLEGSIPAKSSFLVADNTATASNNTNATPRAPLPTPDQEAAFVINNTNFKIALMINQSVLSVDNPFVEESLKDDFADMLGTGTTNGYETAAAAASRPQAPRRTSLADTDNNSADFAQVDYRGTSAGNGMADSELYKY